MSMAHEKQVPTAAGTEPERRDHLRIQWTYLDGRRVRVWSWLPQPVMPATAVGQPPLFLLHGLGCAVEFWLPTLRHLAPRGFAPAVYAVDMPGSGRSEGTRHVLGIPELADWTVRLMTHLGIPKAHLVGNSLGCQVALAIARQNPERAVSLVLGGVTPGGDLMPLWRMGMGLLLDGWREPGVYDGSIPRMYLQTGPRRYFATALKMRDDHPVRDAARVKAPCLVVRGTRDTVVPEGVARSVADALPYGQYQALEGAPHAVQYAVPEAYTRLLTRFCEQTEPGHSGAALVLRAASQKNQAADRDGRLIPGVLPVGGTDAYYELATPGPPSTSLADGVNPNPLPVLLLHGLAGSGEVWSRFLPLLNQNSATGMPPRTVYVPDLPGFGRSSAGPGLGSIDALSDWCVRFLDTVGVARVDIAAHSMGCQVALALAERHPERVGNLVLVGPTTGRCCVPLGRYFLGSVAGSAREPLSYRLLALRMFWRMGLRRYMEAVHEMMRDDVIHRARQVTAPCLLVRGERDTIIPDVSVRALVTALPKGSCQTVENAAHMVPFTAPEDLARLTLSFWEQPATVAFGANLSTDTRVPTAGNRGKAVPAGTK